MKKVVNAVLATALCLAAILCFTACSLFGDDSSTTSTSTSTSTTTTTTTTTVCHHLEEIIPNVDATCTETGLTEGKKCSVCQAILVEHREHIASVYYLVIVHSLYYLTCPLIKTKELNNPR